ncbi:MAG: molybdopterin-guanine dinucleotide biosynthesis protein B [Myxococcota bacterium]|nr:molybdopterin-guanine dinucleotide biosynthesis protein B [Myxococcota bacterium]
MGRCGGRDVVAVVGCSGAGKTSLIVALLPALRARGLRVGAVKHASHGFQADRPGKDSHRLYEAGADAVVLASARQLAVFRRCEHAGDPPLADALAALPPDLDLVLVEGFSWEPVPRLVVVQEGGRTRPRRDPGEVLARVTMPVPGPDGPPRLPSGRLAELVARLEARVRPVERLRALPGGLA